MEWICVKKLEDIEEVQKFQDTVRYTYPFGYKDAVSQFNGASPVNDVFDTIKTKGRVFNRLLSFNKKDIETVWKLQKNSQTWCIDGLDWRYVPFANDPFGNLICFDRTNDHVVFWNHETAEVEEVADSFTEFIDSLYESQYEY